MDSYEHFLQALELVDVGYLGCDEEIEEVLEIRFVVHEETLEHQGLVGQVGENLDSQVGLRVWAVSFNHSSQETNMVGGCVRI